MNTKPLGDSDMHISPLGFGAWAIGGPGWAFAWGAQDDGDSIAAIREALDAGINWIDTAAAYGLGHSEEIVAKALEGVARRPYVFSKCSRTWNERGEMGKSLKADSIRRECEASLRRLRVDAIDLYQIHWPEPDEDVEEGWSTLAALKAEGKVRYIGVSNFDVPQMERAAKIAPITSLQPPYSLLRRNVESEILPYAARNKIGVIAYSPMGSGLLTGAMTRQRIADLPQDDWRRRNPDFQEPKLSRHLELVELLKTIGERNGQTPAVIALAWVLHNQAVSAAIVGLRRPGQLAGVIGAADFYLSPTDIVEIESFLGDSAG
ncbi:MAG TPA: aldo/keto reductase [Pirellulales bacterium]|jgi:aryl-alcohol dehydrogenase-like predicted oxidoreductase|nr:aldo/keto reductase [Pirellulales bacterium]